VVAGFDADSVVAGSAADLIFANESNDTVNTGDGANTVFGGIGNDTILAGAGADTIQANEDNDTIRGGLAIDTISGGSGADVFAYSTAADDGNNAAGGGPVEFITDVDFSVDRFQTFNPVAFAASIPGATGANLNAAADNAIGAAFALNGNAAQNVAAQFTFGGRTYLAINQDAAFNSFNDATDLLVDITGATGTIGLSNFV
jgi:Ca2+-binding RTX toxin-like protein